MRGFFGGGKTNANASNANHGPAPADNVADQKFLAELAVILAEEEEAKKLEAAKQQQQQQQVKDHQDQQQQEEVKDDQEQQEQHPDSQREQLNQRQESQLENLHNSSHKGLDWGPMGYAQLGAGNIPLLAKPAESANTNLAAADYASSDGLESLRPIISSSGSEDSNPNTDGAMNGNHDNTPIIHTPVLDTNDDHDEQNERHPNNALSDEEDKNNNNNNNAPIPTTDAEETMANESPLPTTEFNDMAVATSTTTNQSEETHDTDDLTEKANSQEHSAASDSHPFTPEDTPTTQNDDPNNLVNDTIDDKPPMNPLTPPQADHADDQVLPTQTSEEKESPNRPRQDPSAPQQTMASMNGHSDDKEEPEQHASPISPTSVNLTSSTQDTGGDARIPAEGIVNDDENVENASTKGMQAQPQIDQSTEASEGNSAALDYNQIPREAHVAFEVGDASPPSSYDVNSCQPASTPIPPTTADGGENNNLLLPNGQENIPANFDPENDSTTIPVSLPDKPDSPIQAKCDSDNHDGEDTIEGLKTPPAGLANNSTEEGNSGSPISTGQSKADGMDTSEIVENGAGPREQPTEVRQDVKTSLSTDAVLKDSVSKPGSAIAEESDESTAKQLSAPTDDVVGLADGDGKASPLENSPPTVVTVESSDADNTVKKSLDERIDGQGTQNSANLSPEIIGDIDDYVNGTDEVPGSRSDESAKKSNESGDQNTNNGVHGDRGQGQNEEYGGGNAAASLLAGDKESLLVSLSEGMQAIPNASLEESQTKTEAVAVEESQSSSTLSREQLEVEGSSSDSPSNLASTETSVPPNTSSIVRTKLEGSETLQDEGHDATIEELLSMDESDLFEVDETSPTTTPLPSEDKIGDHQDNSLVPEPESEIQNNEARKEIESSSIAEAVEHEKTTMPEAVFSSEPGPCMPTVSNDMDPDIPESHMPTTDGAADAGENGSSSSDNPTQESEKAEVGPASSVSAVPASSHSDEPVQPAASATDDEQFTPPVGIRQEGTLEDNVTKSPQHTHVAVLDEDSTVQPEHSKVQGTPGTADERTVESIDEEGEGEAPCVLASAENLVTKAFSESKSQKLDVGTHVEEQDTVASSSDTGIDGDRSGEDEAKSENLMSPGDARVEQDHPEETGAPKKDEINPLGAVGSAVHKATFTNGSDASAIKIAVEKADGPQSATATLEQKSPEAVTFAAVVEQSEGQSQRLGQSNSSLIEKDRAAETPQSHDDDPGRDESKAEAPVAPSDTLQNERTSADMSDAESDAKLGKEDNNLTNQNLTKSTDDGQSSEPLKDNSSHDKLFEDFEDIKSSFLRLLSATSSTAATVSEATTPAISSSAATVSEVTAPALVEAGHILSSSAHAANGIMNTCRREIVRRRSERKRVVAFVQDDASSNNSLGSSSLRDEPTETDEFEDSALLSVARALAPDEVETAAVPTRLALSSKSGVDQYRTDVSSFLGDTPIRDNRENSNGVSLQSLDPLRLEGKFNAANVPHYEDPILRAAVAGAERRNGYSQQEKRPRVEKHEFGASLKRFGDFTKATAAILATAALPAYEEAKAITEGVTTSVGLHEQHEEEVLLVESATGQSLSRSRNSRNVFSASGVVLATRPFIQKGEVMFSNASHSTMHKDLASSGAGLKETMMSMSVTGGDQYAPRNTFTGNYGGSTSLSTSGNIFSDGFMSTLNDARGNKGWQDAKNALENPSLVWTTVSERFRSTNNGKAGQEEATSASVFVHERKSASTSSSLSSPASPSVLSGSSSSSSDSSNSQQNSLLTASTTANPFAGTTQEVASYWDMVPTKKATSAIQTGAMMVAGPESIGFRGDLQPPHKFVTRPDALSFDVISPLPPQAQQSYTPDEVSRWQHGTQSAIYNHTEGEEHLALPSMETHVEHKEEDEHIESIQARLPFRGETTQDRPDVSAEAYPSVLESTAHSAEEPAVSSPPLPDDVPNPSALSSQTECASPVPKPVVGQSMNGMTPPLGEKRQINNVAAGASQAVRSVQSADADVEDADSVSQAGYLSLPSTQLEEDVSEIIHTGSKRVRDRALISTPGSASWGMSSLIGNNSFSGSKRSLLSSRRKSQNRRRASSVMNRKASKRLLFNEDSVSQFPALEDLNTGEVQEETIRHSLSTSDLMLLGNETGAPEMFPDFDDASGGDGIGVLPDLALMACYSVANSDIFSELKKPVESESLKYLASVRWRQIVSRWKHHSLSRALLEKPPSSHFKFIDDDDPELSDDEEERTHSTGAQQEDTGWLAALRKSHQHSRVVSETKNLNGVMPHVADGGMRTLSRFLGALGVANGPESALDKRGSSEAILAHILQNKARAVNASTLVKIAKTNLRTFSDLVGNTARFATNNEGGFVEPAAPFSVGIKELEAIERKARRKYSGDILQVKDILRAEIIFEDEGVLVSGLLKLFTLCSSSEKNRDGGHSVEIVRVKNLFFTGSTGMLCPSTLPTGYRHVLVNIRLNGLFLAEIQFQLSEVFGVLGYEGYTLHNEIVALDEACVDSFQSNHGASKIDEKHGTATGAERGDRDNTPVLGSSSEPSSATEAGMPMPVEEHGISKSSNGDSKGEKQSNPEHAAAPGPNPTGSAPTSKTDGGDPTVNTFLDEESGKETAASEKPSDTTSVVGAVDDDNSIVLFDSENRSAHLKDLRRSAVIYSKDELIDALMAHAIKEANSMPRDVPTFFCFHLLLMLETGRITRDSETWNLLFFDAVEWPLAGVPSLRNGGIKLAGSDELGNSQSDDQGDTMVTNPRHRKLKASLQVSKNCLLRCLAVSNQGTAVGMIGWLEYGADNAFGRFASSPFAALQELAYTFASAGDWHFAVDVLRAQITKCDQHLPLYHPCTLSSMIHLAGAARKVGRTRTDCRVIEEAASRLAFYLAEQEDLVLSKLAGSSGERNSTANVLVFESTDSDGVSMLQAFVNSFEAHLSGRFFQLVGVDESGKPNDIMNASHCFQGDAYSVLANCISAREAQLGVSPTDRTRTSQLYWRLAFKHYEMSFKGLLSNRRRLTDGSVVSAAHGMARCLRELGQRPRALQILSLLIAAFGREDMDSKESMAEGPGGTSPLGQVHNFAPFATTPSREAYSRRFCATRHSVGDKSRELMALCLWTMALFAVEEHKNERGRMRALSLLHSASEALRPVVSTIEKDTGNQEDPNVRTLLLHIEQEAEKILAPVMQAVLEAAPQHQVDHRGSEGDQGVLI